MFGMPISGDTPKLNSTYYCNRKNRYFHPQYKLLRNSSACFLNNLIAGNGLTFQIIPGASSGYGNSDDSVTINTASDILPQFMSQYTGIMELSDIEVQAHISAV